MRYLIYIIGTLGLTTTGLDMKVVYIYFTLVALDTIFGAIYYGYREKFSYIQMCRGFAKKLMAIAFFFVVFLVIQGSNIDPQMISVQMIASLLVLSEGYSILGFMYGILTGEKPAEDGISRVIKKVYNIFGSII